MLVPAPLLAPSAAAWSGLLRGADPLRALLVGLLARPGLTERRPMSASKPLVAVVLKGARLGLACFTDEGAW